MSEVSDVTEAEAEAEAEAIMHELRSIDDAISAGEHLDKESDDTRQAPPLRFSAEDMARLTHSVNLMYRKTIGEPGGADWEDASDYTRNLVLANVLQVINTASDPNPYATAQAQHDAWLEKMLREGWKYGPVEDEVNGTHPHLLPFPALPMEQKIKDMLFRNVVRGLLPLWSGQ